MRNSLGLSILLFSLVAVSRAADPDWVPVATELLQREKTGFGGLCGVVVDHQSSDLWVNLSDRGMFSSSDQGQSWKRVSETQPKGRTETPGCWLLDPTGKSQRMVTALVYGAPISVSGDQAATWKSLDGKSGHIDWCAVDWTDPALRFVLALKHEAGGLLLASNDSGHSFTEVGKGFATGWIFDNQTAVVAQAKSKEKQNPHLMRTTDGFRSYHSCGEFSPVGANSAQALPKWHEGALYWLVDGGLIVTTDKAETWKRIGSVKEAQYGPIFGKNARHLFVLTKAGPVESTDGGATWSPPLAPPKDMKGIGGLSWLDYDPQRDTLYLMKMGSDLYRLTRGK
ncbi:MAG: WD40/YVTN/BNR-like repeat-containing protein [Planctomycetaceae bacterium]